MNNNEVEIFYALLPEYWGQGIATEILNYFSEYIFNHTTYQIILAYITQNNIASQKVAEKCGFINKGLVKNQYFQELVFLYKKEKVKPS